jgi:hypothetical protein
MQGRMSAIATEAVIAQQLTLVPLRTGHAGEMAAVLAGTAVARARHRHRSRLRAGRLAQRKSIHAVIAHIHPATRHLPLLPPRPGSLPPITGKTEK